MQSKENWKWGVVFILLTIFLVTATQAYKEISKFEDFDPPDDYKKGDSWDIEQEKLKETPSTPPKQASPSSPPVDTDNDNLDDLDNSHEIDESSKSDGINWDEL